MQISKEETFVLKLSREEMKMIREALNAYTPDGSSAERQLCTTLWTDFTTALEV